MEHDIFQFVRTIFFSWWRNTVVTYIDALDEGVDDGGLTADLHSSFWREALHPKHKLFYQLSEGGTYLPCPDADRDQLRRVGRVLLKSVLDDHPLGPGLSSFVFEYLCDMHEARCFDV